jgi:Asp-tRNA(Asn)/Glu-tRNA(Gln) amidotransferase A subunit family amidase
MVSQAARLAESARMPVTRRPPGTVSRRVANPWSSRRMRSDSSDGSSAVVAASQTTVTPAA